MFHRYMLRNLSAQAQGNYMRRSMKGHMILYIHSSFKLFAHIQNHIENKHSHEADVKAALEIKKQMLSQKGRPVDKDLKEKLKCLQDQMRYFGDHQHNKKVVAMQKGEMLVQRKGCGKKEHFEHREYGPCPGCFCSYHTQKTSSLFQLA